MRRRSWSDSATARLVRVAILALSSSGCAGASSSVCPPWPEAGPAVADELTRLPEAEFAALWDWMARLDVLRDQLAFCR